MKTKLLLYGGLVVGIVGMMPSASLASSSENPLDSSCIITIPEGVVRACIPVVARLAMADEFVGKCGGAFECNTDMFQGLSVAEVLHDCRSELERVVVEVCAFQSSELLPKNIFDRLYERLDAIKSRLNVVNSQLTKLGMETGKMERVSSMFEAMPPEALKYVLGAIVRRVNCRVNCQVGVYVLLDRDVSGESSA